MNCNIAQRNATIFRVPDIFQLCVVIHNDKLNASSTTVDIFPYFHQHLAIHLFFYSLHFN